MTSPGEITHLLQKADQGDDLAAGELFRLVEADLKLIAKNIRRRFNQNLDAPTTMLVDDAFLRLVGRQVTEWKAGDRGRFFSFVATKIHDILVDHVRKNQTKKAGGHLNQASFADKDIEEQLASSYDDDALIMDLHEALARFDQFAEEDANTFRIRYFLDCSFRETADMLSISIGTCKSRYARAKLWLTRELRDYGDES